MTDRTSITTDAAGRRVMAKVGLNGEDATRLQREAELLDAARHPGVVELVGVDGSGVGSMLLTAHVEGPNLASVGPLPLEEAAGLLAALATTIGDLHELGLVHGAVAPEHVIVGPGGRPVLCGLAYGGRAGDVVGSAPSLGRDFTDPARHGAVVLSPAFDVFGLGALARFVAPDPPPRHPLPTVAGEAMADDPAHRPSARTFAKALQHAVPAARLPRGLATQPPARPAQSRPSPAPADPLAALRRAGAAGRRASRPRAATIAGVVVAAGIVGAAIAFAGSAGPAPAPEVSAPVVALPDPGPPQEAEPGPTTTRAGLTSSTSTSTTLLQRAVSRRDCPVTMAVLQADVDGDGCPDALRYADGLLEAGDVRWSLGQAGDQVATGDWGCQGTRTVALFRPSTGEVFRFEGWALPGVDLKATAVARVAGGSALRAADIDRDGCHEAVVERVAGTPEVIRLPRVVR